MPNRPYSKLRFGTHKKKLLRIGPKGPKIGPKMLSNTIFIVSEGFLKTVPKVAWNRTYRQPLGPFLSYIYIYTCWRVSFGTTF